MPRGVKGPSKKSSAAKAMASLGGVKKTKAPKMKQVNRASRKKEESKRAFRKKMGL